MLYHVAVGATMATLTLPFNQTNSGKFADFLVAARRSVWVDVYRGDYYPMLYRCDGSSAKPIFHAQETSTTLGEYAKFGYGQPIFPVAKEPNVALPGGEQQVVYINPVNGKLPHRLSSQMTDRYSSLISQKLQDQRGRATARFTV